MNRTPVKAGTFYVTALGALTMLTVLVSLITLGGCNTVKGAAKDLYSITEGIQNEMSNDNHGDDIRHNDWD